MRCSWSLAIWLAAMAAIAVALAMFGYALFSFPLGVSGTLLRREALVHAGHAFALALPIYACFTLALRRLILAPLRAIHAHLYRVATGQLVPLLLTSRVREVEVMVSSINVMIRRMQLGEQRRDVRAIARQMKALAGRLDTLDREESKELLRIAGQLEYGPLEVPRGEPPVLCSRA